MHALPGGGYAVGVAPKSSSDPARRNGAEPKSAPPAVTGDRSRDEVMSDFRKVAGPLRGRNRGQKPKA